METVVVIGLSILIVGLIGLAAYFVNKFTREEEFMDYTIVENYMPELTGGFSEGDVVGYKKGMYRECYFIRPTDVDYLRRLKVKGITKIEALPVWVYPQQVINLPRGTLSGERNKIKIFPLYPEDVPDKLKQTEFGKIMMMSVAEKKSTKTVVQVLRSERNFEDSMLKDTKGKDLARKRIIEADELNYEYLKKQAEDKSKINYTPGTGGA